jgi:purine-binding chemotaxis protein CheW
MMINTAEMKIILPISIIKRSFKITEKNITLDPGGEKMVIVDEGVKILLDMPDFLGIPPSSSPLERQIVMLLEDKYRKICVCVDELIGECRDTVMPLPAFCGDGSHIRGCVLHNGEIFLVVNHEPLFEGIEPEEPDDGPLNRTQTETAAPAEDKPVEIEDKYMTFVLNGEIYALHISYVKEIISVCEIVPVPKASYAVDGVFNRRGDIIPVVNLLKLFGTGQTDGRVSIIILEYEGLTFGIMADKVNEPVKLNEESIKPLPSHRAVQGNAYVNKLGRYNENVILILELNRVVEAIT